MSHSSSRRQFLQTVGLGTTALGLGGMTLAQGQSPPPTDDRGNVIAGFEKNSTDPNASKSWQPFSDRKIRVGIAGYGLCRFGAQFGFQDHPNVEIVAVTDLVPSQCAELAKVCGCEQTYPSFEKMILDDRIEARDRRRLGPADLLLPCQFICHAPTVPGRSVGQDRLLGR